VGGFCAETEDIEGMIEDTAEIKPTERQSGQEKRDEIRPDPLTAS